MKNLCWLMLFFTFLNTASAQWEFIGGQARDIGVGADGTTWVIGWNQTGNDYPIAKWNGNFWEEIPGAAVRIDVGPNGRSWVVNSAGYIYRYNGSAWDNIGGQARDVGIGADGTVWVIGWSARPGGYNIARWNGNFWEEIPGGGVRIDVDPNGRAWIVNDAGNIFRYNGSTWDGLPGQGRDISIGADGTPWLIGWTATPGGYFIYQWNGSSWLDVPGGATNISAGRGVVWGVNDAGLIFRQNVPNSLTNSMIRNAGAMTIANPVPQIKGTKLQVTTQCGSDDLRHYNTAQLTVNFNNGLTSREYLVHRGLRQNQSANQIIYLDEEIDLTNVRSISIRHDGTPVSSNNPFNMFDTYDNWDLMTLRIALIKHDGSVVNIYNNALSTSGGDRVPIRFTGQKRIGEFMKQP